MPNTSAGKTQGIESLILNRLLNAADLDEFDKGLIKVNLNAYPRKAPPRLRSCMRINP